MRNRDEEGDGHAAAVKEACPAPTARLLLANQRTLAFQCSNSARVPICRYNSKGSSEDGPFHPVK